jgi:hypothetical protein
MMGTVVLWMLAGGLLFGAGSLWHFVVTVVPEAEAAKLERDMAAVEWELDSLLELHSIPDGAAVAELRRTIETWETPATRHAAGALLVVWHRARPFLEPRLSGKHHLEVDHDLSQWEPATAQAFHALKEKIGASQRRWLRYGSPLGVVTLPILERSLMTHLVKSRDPMTDRAALLDRVREIIDNAADLHGLPA